MGDDTPQQPKSDAMPPLPSSGTSGSQPAPTKQLPPIRRAGSPGKVVVMLSSVAKAAPAVTQPLQSPGRPAPTADAPADAPTKALLRPPPLPVKAVAPETPQQRLSVTTHVKLPPKTGANQIAPLSGSVAPTPVVKEAPFSLSVPTPLLPPKTTSLPKISALSPRPEATPPVASEQPVVRATPPPLPVESVNPIRPLSKKTGAQHIPPIKFNAPEPDVDASSDSIFLGKDATPEPPKEKPQGWKSLEPGELKTASVPAVQPPALPVSKPADVPTSHPLHVAPPMLGKTTEHHAEKFPQPHITTESPEVMKAPPLLGPESPVTHKPLSALPGKASPSSTPPTEKGMTTWLKKKSSPIVVSSVSPKLTETKPALKPPVLAKRVLAQATEAKAETPVVPEEVVVKPKEPEPLPSPVPVPVPAPAVVLPTNTPEPIIAPLEAIAVAATAATVLPTAKSEPVSTQPSTPSTPTTKAPLPLTRAARAKKRRVTETVVFYLIFVITLGVLIWGGLFFGRDTRIEGQVIPPPGMTLNDEVWVVTDFRVLASGIAEDLAAERTPLMQEIQERQEHVQRAQADVAAREERIRLIEQEIQAAKDEMAATGKQAQDATQQIWSGEGAEIDSEYDSKINDLEKLIGDRAKSLNLKYDPDPAFKSPEVWANAYRLALYDVPASVDQVKEHQWLSDTMKQWRDFVKTLDDRKEQLRQKADDIKTASGPKITDLQAKVDDATQRADATGAEEVPLKAELQQAQSDLVDAQASDASLDDKYYKQLDALPGEAVTQHLSLSPNGRFTLIDNDIFAEGQKEHNYWLYACATRADGRQYWALGHVSIQKNHKLCVLIDPDSFVSTKAILRPNLSPDDQDQ
jgi:hypothetical protein